MSLFTVSVHAQNQFNLPAVVVTATRSEQPITDVVADVSVIDREEIEKSGATDLATVLNRLAGISIYHNGGPGTVSGVFVRGAETRFTSVFIDGVRVDSQSTGGASWNAIPVSQIDRIEVLRGAAAAVYGSDAIAGVVQIFTRQGEEGFFPSIQTALGSFNTSAISASIRGGTETIDYALSAASEMSQGFNAHKTSNADRDGYTKRSFSSRLGWKLTETQKLEFSLLDHFQNADYDNTFDTSNSNDVNQNRLQTAGLTWSAVWNNTWNTRLSIANSTDHYEIPSLAYLVQTRIKSYLLRNELKQGNALINIDFEHREDALDSADTSPSRSTHQQNALALGLGWRAGAHTLQTNIRRDQDSAFGNNNSGALAYAYQLTQTLRISTSAGTAFRVPTLYQRFSIYGADVLKAETSQNKEVALHWQEGVNHASWVVFRNDVTNLIDYVSGPSTACSNGSGEYPGCYFNVGKARMSGQSIRASTQLKQLVNIGGSVDFLSPENLDTGKWLPRRPRLQAKLYADMPLAGFYQLGGELVHVGERYDDAGNISANLLKAYNLVNVSLSRSIAKDWQVLFRINNVGNEQYETAKNYTTPGRSYYLSLKWEPR